MPEIIEAVNRAAHLHPDRQTPGQPRFIPLTEKGRDDLNGPNQAVNPA